jgi:hypothetical protein
VPDAWCCLVEADFCSICATQLCGYCVAKFLKEVLVQLSRSGVGRCVKGVRICTLWHVRYFDTLLMITDGMHGRHHRYQDTVFATCTCTMHAWDTHTCMYMHPGVNASSCVARQNQSHNVALIYKIKIHRLFRHRAHVRHNVTQSRAFDSSCLAVAKAV